MRSQVTIWKVCNCMTWNKSYLCQYQEMNSFGLTLCYSSSLLFVVLYFVIYFIYDKRKKDFITKIVILLKEFLVNNRELLKRFI